VGSKVNSSQRRKAKREYPHFIKLSARPGWAYFEHDDMVQDARKWCRKNTKGYIIDEKWDHATFKFTTEKDAVIFALKWL